MKNGILKVHRAGTPTYGAYEGLLEVGSTTEHRSTGTEHYTYYCKPEDLEAAKKEFLVIQQRAEEYNKKDWDIWR